MTTTKQRDIDLDAIQLDHGSHQWIGNGHLLPDQRMCIMEAVSWVAGEKWTDHPKCVSPVIGAFLRSWNDTLDQEGRQKLKPYIEKVVGTVSTKEVEQKRGLMAADWFIHHHLPAWLTLAGLDDVAESIRTLPVLDTWDAVEDALPTLREAEGRAEAAWSAARSAARSAAESAAWSAAESAASDVLRPTSLSLQESAFELLDKVIAVTAVTA